jgi:hypothetical protein
MGLLIAFTAQRRREAAPPAEAPPRSTSRRSLAVRARGRFEGRPGRAAARFAMALGVAYLVAFAAGGTTLLLLGLTPGEALSRPPKVVGAGRLLRFGRQVEGYLRARDVSTLSRYLDERRFLARVARLAPDDLVTLRRVREATEGGQLARRLVDAFPPGASPALTACDPGPPISLGFGANGRTVRLDVEFGWENYLTVVDVEDDQGPWSQQLLRELGGGR